ncbi:hypothetical protein RHSIM_RhsimUnG0096900 [Rhododendron simsii]|uniref:beta-N-acetylhexosaminidase n=1 Tax=Rhododendron simsii TaxID=118357 RepID=A0A834FVY9_RHOSS|nr:hypothetical protein RHSIM_RhsimUnG0096900 [Rhododendron simsii]
MAADSAAPNPSPLLICIYTVFVCISVSALVHAQTLSLGSKHNSISQLKDTLVYLWPLPAEYTFGYGTLSVDPDLSLAVGGNGGNSTIVRDAFERYRAIIFKHGPSNFRPMKSHISKVRVVVHSDNEELQLGTDESYSLIVAESDDRSIIAEATIEHGRSRPLVNQTHQSIVNAVSLRGLLLVLVPCGFAVPCYGQVEVPQGTVSTRQGCGICMGSGPKNLDTAVCAEKTSLRGSMEDICRCGRRSSMLQSEEWSFHDISAPILSLHADALLIDNTLSKFFSDVVPRPVDVETRDFSTSHCCSGEVLFDRKRNFSVRSNAKLAWRVILINGQKLRRLFDGSRMYMLRALVAKRLEQFKYRDRDMLKQLRRSRLICKFCLWSIAWVRELVPQYKMGLVTTSNGLVGVVVCDMLMADTSRHYYPVDVIKQIIESMSYAKLNVLHWHIIDEESFPLEVPTYPKLWKGAYSKWERYTIEDADEIVNLLSMSSCCQIVKLRQEKRLRRLRFTDCINVMAEVDVPGHAESWGAGYPDLWPSASCREPLDVSKNFTFDLIAGILTDMRKIFPFELFHLGGDEVHTDCWTSTPHVQQWLRDHNMTAKDAYQYFVLRAQQIAISKNWTPVNWEETFNAFPTKLNPRTVVHNWLGGGVCPKAVGQGFRCIFSNQGFWYLDHLDVQWDGVYNAEPLEGISGVSDQQLVLGGEVCMWGETADPSVVQQTIWPRAAAAAERLWSNREAISTRNINITALPRLEYFRCLLTRRGVPAAPVTNFYARSPPSGPGSCYEQ